MAEHRFELKGNWTGGRLGEGSIGVGNLQSTVSVPTELGGPGQGTNPEEMLIGAASTCYMITLAAMMDNRQLPVKSFTLTTEGVVSEEGGLHFQKLIHRPVIVLGNSATQEQVDKASALPERAEKACMISKALRGNVEVTVEANVTLEA